MVAELRARDTKRKEWFICNLLEFDFVRNQWVAIRRWSNNDNDWCYNVEIKINGQWCKLNEL